ncbi:MAG: FAD-dependent oxidoreductase [Thermoanaerobaculia bacterium]|nr:FAD-dependent oxidoreductase [Thermoanaerobaculia bacterium]
MSPIETDTSRASTPDQIRDRYDVVVVGGGPAGATAATLLAQRGRDVLLLERDVFPRFKIGESLIPAVVGTLERLGMIEKMSASNFPKKYSVQFFSGSGKSSAPFYFSETETEEQSQTWQVLRADFDTMMFDNAVEHGVDGLQGAAVRRVLFDSAEPETEASARGVQVEMSDGSKREIRSRVVVDATGQRAMISRQLGLRTTDPRLRQASIFTHYRGAVRDEGIDEGATLILQTRDKNSWFWFIPLPDDTASVGVVGQIDYLIQGRQGDPQKIFDEELALCPGLTPRLSEAEQLFPVRVLNEFSYMTRRPAGDGWVLAGDAFGFLDPMYSTGVLLALKSGEFVGDTVADALDADDVSGGRLGSFAPRLLEGMSAFRRLVYAFYDQEFSFGRFLKKFPHHRRDIVSILVGDVFDKDFEPLFGDLATMIDLPNEPYRVPMQSSERATATV